MLLLPYINQEWFGLDNGNVFGTGPVLYVSFGAVYFGG